MSCRGARELEHHATVIALHAWRPSGTTGQQYDDHIDFDGDGKPDPFNVVDDGGSGEGGRTVTIKLGRNGLEIRADVTFSFYGFVAHNFVPDVLVGDENNDLRKAVESVLFARVCDPPGPSLERLLDERHRLRWYARRTNQDRMCEGSAAHEPECSLPAFSTWLAVFGGSTELAGRRAWRRVRQDHNRREANCW